MERYSRSARVFVEHQDRLQGSHTSTVLPDFLSFSGVLVWVMALPGDTAPIELQGKLIKRGGQ